jgi:hypothetical protein
MKCKHEDWRQWYRVDPIRDRNIVSIICATCGDWLSLGPSSDDTPEVRIEIRAAEIVTEAVGRGLAAWDNADYEWYGFLAFINTPTDAYGLTCDEPGFQAGWLARCIATHGTAEAD